MNRRIWTGILAGVLAATVLLGVAAAAYRAGQSHEVVTRTVGDGDVVRVVGGYGWGPGWGHGDGFFVFPLLLTVVLVLLLVRAFRGGGYGGPWGRGYGPCGPDRAARFEEEHLRAHQRDGEPTEA